MTDEAHRLRTSVQPALLVLFAALLACGGSPKEKCSTAVDYNGHRRSSIGTGETKDAARRSSVIGSCMAYCDYADPALELAWRAWKKTPEGKRSTSSRAFDIASQLKGPKAACEKRCGEAIASAQAKTKTECL